MAASWGDWPTKTDADTYAPTRKLGFIISKDWGSTFTVLRPAGEDTEQGPATVAVSGGVAYIMWKAPNAIKLARVQ